MVTISDIKSLSDLANKDILMAGVGVGGGFVASEFASEFVKTSLNLTGNVGMVAKGATKGGLAVALGMIAYKVRGPLATLAAGAASIGSLGAVFKELIEFVMTYIGWPPGGAVAAGQIAGAKLRGLSVGAKTLAPKGQGTITDMQKLAGGGVAAYSNLGIPPATIAPLAAGGVQAYTGIRGTVKDFTSPV